MDNNEELNAVDQVPEEEKLVETEEVQESKGEETPEDFHVPKKLLGKSNEEIIREYQELEKTLGRQGRELGELRKKTKGEESTPIASRPVVDPTPERNSGQEDLDKFYDELWEQNPKQAPKLYAQLIRERDRQQELLNQTTQIVQAASEGRLPGYEDFNDLRPTMVSVANELLPYVAPSEVNNPKVFQALYLIAKGLTLPNKLKDLEKEAMDKAKKKVVEKQLAFSEDGTSSSESESVPFSAKHMSYSEMKKVLGISD